MRVPERLDEPERLGWEGGVHVTTTATVRTSTTHGGPSVCTQGTPSADHRES